MSQERWYSLAKAQELDAPPRPADAAGPHPIFTMFLLQLQLLTTLAMFGLIWFVQIVHYPLFAQVGELDFCGYAGRHATRTTWIVAPLMLMELISACLLLIPALRLPAISLRTAWAGAVLLAVIWLSTALLQVPLHTRLQAAFSSQDARRLVTTNWVRTIAWSLRAALVLHWTYTAMPR